MRHLCRLKPATPVGRPNVRVLARDNMKSRPELEKIQCAFCKGKGKDPFGIMSKFATCQVCNGTGSHMIASPHKECSYCHGSGVEFNTRNTCLSCGGKGRVSISENSAICSACHGSGMEHETNLRCGKCGGSGVVETKE